MAAELLGQEKSSAAQGLLRARYERERDPIVKEAIADAVSVRPAEPARGFDPGLPPNEPKAGE